MVLVRIEYAATFPIFLDVHFNLKIYFKGIKIYKVSGIIVGEFPKYYEIGSISQSLLQNLFSYWLFYKHITVAKYQVLTVPASSTSTFSYTVTLPTLGPIYEVRAILLGLNVSVNPYIGLQIDIINLTTGTRGTVGKFDASVYNQAQGGRYETIINHLVRAGDSIRIDLIVTNTDRTASRVLVLNSMWIEIYYRLKRSYRVPSKVIVKDIIPVDTYKAISIPKKTTATYTTYTIQIPKPPSSRIYKVVACGGIASPRSSYIQVRVYDPITATWKVIGGTYAITSYPSYTPCFFKAEVSRYIYNVNTLQLDIYYSNVSSPPVVLTGYLWSLWLEVYYIGV